MLKLPDLIRLAGVELFDFKIHCATGERHPPLEAFFDGSWRKWQECQNQKNFECAQILSLIHLGGTRWLFAGIFAVLGVKEGNALNPAGFEYVTQELDGLGHLTGRAIVTFEKNFRASYLRGEKFGGELIVAEIRDNRMTIGDFPGFDGVLLSYKMLGTIIRELNPSWQAALSNVSGVYVIADTSTGKQYIGSAYGGVGIWQRWSEYAQSGHGGNVELRKLLSEYGPDHVHQLQFSLLEICDLNSATEYVVSRECHWKAVLCTREFGLNSN